MRILMLRLDEIDRLRFVNRVYGRIVFRGTAEENLITTVASLYR